MRLCLKRPAKCTRYNYLSSQSPGVALPISDHTVGRVAESGHFSVDQVRRLFELFERLRRQFDGRQRTAVGAATRVQLTMQLVQFAVQLTEKQTHYLHDSSKLKATAHLKQKHRNKTVKQISFRVDDCRLSATKLILSPLPAPGTTCRATSRPHHLCLFSEAV